MTAERPLIMTAESVRAILAGAKTQTRRLIEMCEFGPTKTYGYDWNFRDRRGLWNDYTTKQLLESKWCRFLAGTRLWAKERHAIEGQLVAYDADGWAGAVCEDGGGGLLRLHHGFVSTGGIDSIVRGDSEKLGARFGLGRFGGRWRSPLFMPRWASRLTLEVTEVRVQRLQAISEGDARAEGCRGVHGATDQMIPGPPRTAREDYCDRWDRINGKRAAWASNPWVWAITFRRVP